VTAGGRHAALLAALTLVGCDGKPTAERAPRRSGDAGPPVVIVDKAPRLSALVAEVEPNDEPAAAMALPVPGGIDGSLGAGDVDHFALTAERDGVLMLRLEPDAALDATLELAGEGDKVVARSDRGPAGTVEGLPNVPVVRGKRYVVSVSRFVKKAPVRKGSSKAGKGKGGEAAADGAAQPALGYKLYAELVTPSEAMEREPNDEPGKAREVLLGDEAEGYLGWPKDVDVWTLSTAGFTADYALDVAIDGVEGVALTAELVARGEVLATRKGGKGEGVLIRGVLPGGVASLTLRLSGSGANPEAAYRLRTQSRSLAEGEERELNDTERQAMAAEQGSVRGFLDGGDLDLYRFSAAEAVVLSVWVSPPGAIDVVLRALAPGGKELGKADGGKAGARERLDELALRPGRDVVIEVSGKGPSDLADGYTLSWSYFPGEPAPPDPRQPELGD
jgi:hypothetical protein